MMKRSEEEQEEPGLGGKSLVQKTKQNHKYSVEPGVTDLNTVKTFSV